MFCDVSLLYYCLIFLLGISQTRFKCLSRGSSLLQHVYFNDNSWHKSSLVQWLAYLPGNKTMTVVSMIYGIKFGWFLDNFEPQYLNESALGGAVETSSTRNETTRFRDYNLEKELFESPPPPM